MESLDLELELNALRYNSHFESDFDSPIQMDEVSERIILTSAAASRRSGNLRASLQP